MYAYDREDIEPSKIVYPKTINFCDINSCDINFYEFGRNSQKLLSQKRVEISHSQKLMSQKIFKLKKTSKNLFCLLSSFCPF